MLDADIKRFAIAGKWRQCFPRADLMGAWFDPEGYTRGLPDFLAPSQLSACFDVLEKVAEFYGIQRSQDWYQCNIYDDGHAVGQGETKNLAIIRAVLALVASEAKEKI